MPECRIRMGGRPGAVEGTFSAGHASATGAATGVLTSIGTRAGLSSATGATFASSLKVRPAAGHAAATGIARNASTAAQVSNVVVTPTQTSVGISWHLTVAGPGRIQVHTSALANPSTNGTLSTYEPNPFSDHGPQVITGLTAGTLYWYRVWTDALGNGTPAGTFTTVASDAYPATSTLAYVAPTAPALPNVGVSTADSTWNTLYVRVGNGGSDGPLYPTHQPWSASGTYLLDHYAGLVLDATTFATVRTVGSQSEPHWAYCRSGSSASESWIFRMSGLTLQYLDVVTGSTTTVRDFSSTHSAMNFGRFEGNQSRDDRYFPMWGTTTGGSPVILRYDRIADTYVQKVLSVLPDAIHMSPTGNFMMSVYSANGTAEGGGCVLYDSTLTRMRNVTDDGGNHGDFGYDASGNEIWVYTNNPVTFPGGANVRSFRADQATDALDVGNLLPGGTTGFQSQQGHVSMQAIDRPGKVYLSANRHSTDAGAYQVFSCPTDGSAAAAGAGVEVFGFHRSAFVTTGSQEAYDRSPFATPNQNGTRVFVKSVWQNTATDGQSLPYYGFVFSV